jgi:hypothetical protein
MTMDHNLCDLDSRDMYVRAGEIVALGVPLSEVSRPWR